MQPHWHEPGPRALTSRAEPGSSKNHEEVFDIGGEQAGSRRWKDDPSKGELRARKKRRGSSPRHGGLRSFGSPAGQPAGRPDRRKGCRQFSAGRMASAFALIHARLSSGSIAVLFSDPAGGRKPGAEGRPRRPSSYPERRRADRAGPGSSHGSGLSSGANGMTSEFRWRTRPPLTSATWYRKSPSTSTPARNRVRCSQSTQANHISIRLASTTPRPPSPTFAPRRGPARMSHPLDWGSSAAAGPTAISPVPAPVADRADRASPGREGRPPLSTPSGRSDRQANAC